MRAQNDSITALIEAVPDGSHRRYETGLAGPVTERPAGVRWVPWSEC